MQALRTTTRVASRFRAVRGAQFVRGYADSKTYEHIIVSTPEPGVGFGMLSHVLQLAIQH